ncbi:MAG: DUF4062 domain-containing protein [Allomuricauda sp.]
MISSTLEDLPNHRDSAKDIILAFDCLPVMMELDSAKSDSDAITDSFELVEKASIYIGVFGKRYGYVPKDENRNPNNLSITELEYRRAKEIGKQVLVFMYDSKHHSFYDYQTDGDDLNAAKKRLKFYRDLKTRERIGFFKNADHLTTLIGISIRKTIEKLSAIRSADQSFVKSKYSIKTPPDFWEVPPYRLTKKFIGRSSELKKLNEWAVSKDSILIVEGIGGLGKSALTYEWSTKYAFKTIDNLYGRVWWSFYEKTSLEEFVKYTLAYLTKHNPNEIGLDYEQNAKQLILELNARPSLLILDGFERVLAAYHRWDKAQQRDENIAIHKRACVNPIDENVLQWLIHANPSKILVTSRLFPSALEDIASHSPMPNVSHYNLEGLSDKDVINFTRDSGVQGNRKEILRFSAKFGGHSLVLKIVCGMITNYRKKPGSFDEWIRDPNHGGSLKLSNLDLRQNKTDILEFALSGLESKTNILLQRIAVLSEDIDYEAIKAINPFVPPKMNEPKHIKKSIRWNYLWDDRHKQKVLKEYEKEYNQKLKEYNLNQTQLKKTIPNLDDALTELEDRGLLQWDRYTNRYNMHPVVRGVSSDLIDKNEKVQTFKIARDHFSAMPEDDIENAKDLEQISTSLNIYNCLIGQNLNDDAIGFYRQKLSDFLQNRIAAFTVVVEHLEPLFDSSLDDFPNLMDTQDQAWVLLNLSVGLDKIGRHLRAKQLISNSIQINLSENRLLNASNNLAILCNIFTSLDKQYEASRTIQLRTELAELLDDKKELINAKLFEAGEGVKRGNFVLANKFFKENVEYVNDFPNAAFWEWVNAFFQGNATYEAWLKGFQLAEKKNSLTNQRFFLSEYAVWQMEMGEPQKAIDAIDKALRLANQMGESTPRSHKIRAWALSALGRYEDARNELRHLTETSPSYFIAESLAILGDEEKAKSVAFEAYKRYWGYGKPYCDFYGLDRIEKFMKRKGLKIPKLHPFDIKKTSYIPYEKEILDKIDELKKKSASNDLLA